MVKKNKSKVEIIAEFRDCWIQRHKGKDWESYDLFILPNMVMVSMMPEDFENLRKLFKIVEQKSVDTSYVT